MIILILAVTAGWRYKCSEALATALYHAVAILSQVYLSNQLSFRSIALLSAAGTVLYFTGKRDLQTVVTCSYFFSFVTYPYHHSMADMHAAQLVGNAEQIEEGMAGAAPPVVPAATPGQPMTPNPTVGSGAPGGVANPGVGAVVGEGRPSAIAWWRA